MLTLFAKFSHNSTRLWQISYSFGHVVQEFGISAFQKLVSDLAIFILMVGCQNSCTQPEKFNCDTSHRLPNILSHSFNGITTEYQLFAPISPQCQHEKRVIRSLKHGAQIILKGINTTKQPSARARFWAAQRPYMELYWYHAMANSA